MTADRRRAAGLLRTADIQIRDPYVLTLPEQGRYVLFGTTDPNPWGGPGTGFDCYESDDLEHWRGPIAAFRAPEGFWGVEHFWAPEVHWHDGRYFLFASFAGSDGLHGTQILAADSSTGPYAPWSDGAVTPAGWTCIDGTLHVDDHGLPWIVFCREWMQVDDGQILAQRLSVDLTRAEGEPTLLFRASEAEWSTSIGTPPDAEAHPGIFVTDGPFLRRLGDGTLVMLWSSFGEQGYAMGVARSRSGSVLGPWVQEAEPLWRHDGGHGMFAERLDEGLFVTLHQPNLTPHERAVFAPVVEVDGTIRLA